MTNNVQTFDIDILRGARVVTSESVTGTKKFVISRAEYLVKELHVGAVASIQDSGRVVGVVR